MKYPRIILISGKGGVGKSLISLGIAAAHSKQGRKVLVVELGEASHYRHLFSQSFGFLPLAVSVGGAEFQVARWTGRDCLEEYFTHVFKIKSLAQAFFSSPIMKALIGAAPALADVAILGKLTSDVRAVGPPFRYDLIVVDAYSTGHYLALMRAPLGLADAVQSGPMGSQSRQIHQVLLNREVVSHGIVTTFEEASVQEAEQLYADLIKEGVQPFVIGNLFLPEVKGGEGGGNSQFLQYLAARYSQQKKFLQRMSDVMGKPFLVDQIFSQDREILLSAMAEQIGAWRGD